MTVWHYIVIEIVLLVVVPLWWWRPRTSCNHSPDDWRHSGAI